MNSQNRSLTPFQESIVARNNVQIGGRGRRPMMFAHGFGCDQNMWRFVAPNFASEYRTILFDYVGSGQSEKGAFNASRYEVLEGYAQDILEICEVLDLQQVVLVGHSVSAMIGLLAAIRQPQRFASLVMVGPSPHYMNDPPHYFGGLERGDIDGLIDLMDHNYIGWAQHLAPMVMGNAERPELAQELERSFCSTDPHMAKVFAKATFYADNRSDLAMAPVPSLILQVRDDPIAPLSVGDYMASNMPGSVLHVLEASGHCPHISHPAATTAAIKQFLDEQHAFPV